MSRRAVFVPACLIVAAVAVAGRFPAAAGRTVWDGVYGAAQAERGKDVYAQECSACHGDFLEGGANDRAAPLSGTEFADSWESASLNDLFVKIGRTMPRDAPGSLDSRQTLDLMAFLLQYNGFPAGTELAQTPELALIDIVGKDGPRPLRPGAGVRAVGCLTPDAGDTWTLTLAGAPVRTRTPGVSTGPDVDRAKTAPLGTRTLKLANAKPGPEARGAKVEVKGVLASTEDAISVMSLQVVDAACGAAR